MVCLARNLLRPDLYTKQRMPILVFERRVSGQHAGAKSGTRAKSVPKRLIITAEEMALYERTVLRNTLGGKLSGSV